jgi:hypothetical protein
LSVKERSQGNFTQNSFYRDWLKKMKKIAENSYSIYDSYHSIGIINTDTNTGKNGNEAYKTYYT